MPRKTKRILALAVLAGTALHAQNQKKVDTSKHSVQMVTVANDVRLEVLDWGGTGRPLVLLTGLGDDAHIFDHFAPKLTNNFHVYGISRRGRGASSRPQPTETNYSADRLGEDVLAVIAALHLHKPLIVGHSIAGEELSYIGAHHPEKVAGLVYMEAGYPYALYDQANGELELDALALRKQLSQFTTGYAYEPVNNYPDLVATLDRVKTEVKQHEQETKNLPHTPVSPRMTPDLFAIMDGRERFTTIHAPSLIIFGVDPAPITGDTPQTGADAARLKLMMNQKSLQIAAWKRQVPTAHLILIPHATHYIFRSNEAEVILAINDFVATLH